MSSGDRWPLAQAEAWAIGIARQLSGSCERITIAGSLRRRSETVGDVEIVLLPKIINRVLSIQADLFGGEQRMVRTASLAWEKLDEMTIAGLLPEKSKGGDRYRCYLPGPDRLQLDVFSVGDPRGWGALLAMRTGPANYSKRCMVSLNRQGYHMSGGLLYIGSTIVPCKDEQDFFRCCGMRMVPPQDRQ
jgi:DNA polymerase/3'-5' exonuclease PolX